MVTPQRSDSEKAIGRNLGHRPIVLARLPQVGTSSQIVSFDTNQGIDSYSDTVSLYPATPSDSPETIQRLDLLQHPSGPRHFVDGRHAEPLASERYETQPSQGTPHHDEQRKHYSPRPSLLHELQVRMAPYAGIIVTLALLASAGLLYWLVAGPTRPTIDYLQLPTGGFGQNDSPSPVDSPADQPREGQIIASEEWSHVPPANSQSSEATTTGPNEEGQDTATAAEETTPAVPSPQPVDLSFAKTDRPAAIDFSLILGPNQRATHAAGHPAVAQRGASQPQLPVKR